MKSLWIFAGVIVVIVAVGAWILRPSTVPSVSVSPLSNTTDIAKTSLPVLAESMPTIDGIASWINSEPLTNEALKGKVVLVDFWTYSCINCIRTLPYIADWWTKYQDEHFVIIGIHAPEFEFEKDRNNVIAAAQKYNLTFPIAQDNNHVTWNHFRNRYWPAKYLFDQEGKLRYVHFGEGNYTETESAIQSLLAVNDDMSHFEEPNLQSINSPETYFGYWRSEHFASPEKAEHDATSTYSFAESLKPNQWDLQGNWLVSEQFVEAQEPGARLRFHYSASKANLVMAINDQTIQDVAIYLDGQRVPDEYLGKHVQYDQDDNETIAKVSLSDLYELIAGTPGEHILEIESLGEGLQIYAITFG